MKNISHTRRRLATAILLGVASRWVHAEPSLIETERTKREFMELAIKEINDKVRAIQIEREEIKKSGGVAPLFAQLPRIVPFLDWDYYYIDRDLRWAPPSSSSLPSVTVPKGFVCDLASVPRLLWAKYPPTGRYAYAAVVHDYLYWNQTTSKDDADKIIKLAMQDTHTDAATISDFQTGLSIAGWKAWSDNKKAKANGEKRILAVFPDQNQFVSWPDWKSRPNVFKD